MDFKWIEKKLRKNWGRFPIKEAYAALEHSKESYIWSFKVIKEVFKLYRTFKVSYRWYHRGRANTSYIFALYLLSYFKINATSELVIEFIESIDNDSHFGHTAPEFLGRVLATNCLNDFTLLFNIIENPECIPLVRKAAIHALLVLIAEGLLRRIEVFNYFARLFKSDLEKDESAAEVWKYLVRNTYYLRPDELQKEIDYAIESHLFPFDEIEVIHFSKYLYRTDEEILTSLKANNIYYFIDKESILMTKDWPCFQPIKINRATRRFQTLPSKYTKNKAESKSAIPEGQWQPSLQMAEALLKF